MQIAIAFIAGLHFGLFTVGCYILWAAQDYHPDEPQPIEPEKKSDLESLGYSFENGV